ncbi:hypothetical protein KIPB_003163, partial [Kipferlia bialata]
GVEADLRIQGSIQVVAESALRDQLFTNMSQVGGQDMGQPGTYQSSYMPGTDAMGPMDGSAYDQASSFRATLFRPSVPVRPPQSAGMGGMANSPQPQARPDIYADQGITSGGGATSMYAMERIDAERETASKSRHRTPFSLRKEATDLGAVDREGEAGSPYIQKTSDLWAQTLAKRRERQAANQRVMSPQAQAQGDRERERENAMRQEAEREREMEAQEERERQMERDAQMQRESMAREQEEMERERERSLQMEREQLQREEEEREREAMAARESEAPREVSNPLRTQRRSPAPVSAERAEPVQERQLLDSRIVLTEVAANRREAILDKGITLKAEPFMESSILTREQAMSLYFSLPFEYAPSTHLIWSSVKYGFSMQTLHALVDSNGTTVLVAKCGDKVFGGFASTPWNTSGVRFGTARCFLFSLTDDLLIPFNR